MGDGASSSSSDSSNSSGGGGGGGNGNEGGGGRIRRARSGSSVVVDHGERGVSCGYCRSSGNTSISHGLWAYSMTVDDYQELLDRGWRRSGCYLYKPDMESTCCPSYTIRLKAGDFVPSKEQLRVHKKMQRYLDGKVNMHKVRRLKEEPNSPKGSVNLDGDASSSTVQSITGKESPAVGVVDILPSCLSSKYLFWDPDLAFLSLGKYSALQEINWVKEAGVHCPSLQYYYLGYYIHSCSKMRYKAAYRPSELLCPLRYEWVPFENAKPLLDKSPYAVLSDYLTINCHAALPQLPSTSIGRPDFPRKDDPGKAFSNEDVDRDFDLEGSDSYAENDSDSEASCELLTDDIAAVDVGNILIDVNSRRVRFKDLQQMFGPIDKRFMSQLEMQLHRYVRAVGQELSNRVVYSLGS